jgi:hypothetical protein
MNKPPSSSTLVFDFPVARYTGEPAEIIKEQLRAAINKLKDALHVVENVKFPKQHIEKKEAVLKNMKKWKKEGKPERSICSIYDSDRDSTYELFMTYYKLVENILEIEKRQLYHRAGIDLTKSEKRDCCAVIQYAYWRWVDVGTPSISGYTKGREIIKYGTLFLTLIANGFKLALARMGGRASFIGTALQGVAHLSFALYFMLLTQHDKALALPKIVGLVISFVSCIWIAEAGNGYL